MKILTFDIEEWFHIMGVPSAKDENQWDKFEVRIHKNLEKILKVLNEKDQKATFFCLGWIGKKYPELVKEIDKCGHEIASHSNIHKPVYNMEKNEFKKDTEISIKTLEDITGKKVRIYRAPSFSIKKENVWAFEVLIELGITIDSSIFPTKRANGGFEEFQENSPIILDINGFYLKEFPINTFKFLNKKVVFSGGGYFRVLPYFVIKYLMKKSEYVMTYFHPRDFDENQPVFKDITLKKRFKSYVGLKSAFLKLEKLLSDFKFVDIDKADKTIEWKNTKIKSIETYRI